LKANEVLNEIENSGCAEKNPAKVSLDLKPFTSIFTRDKGIQKYAIQQKNESAISIRNRVLLPCPNICCIVQLR